MMVKVRFAPSPTGIPHVGNIRTALFDYFFAKANKGNFLLRIEDTDQARKLEGAEEIIKDGLAWLGVSWDDYVVQSTRLTHYVDYANKLVEKGLARNEEGAIRFLVPNESREISWVDAVGKKTVVFQQNDIEDFIILKKDGYPTYHLANVIDDHLMEVTHVIRGEDWIPSTPKHILLYEAFGWEKPVFAHVPNVLGVDGKKLSKRRGAKSVLEFRDEGILADALRNYLMLLGWSPKDDREILTHDQIAHDFSLDNVNAAPSIFDEKKLLWMNGEYIRSMSAEDLATRILEYDPTILSILDEQEFSGFVIVAQTRIKTLKDFRSMVEPFILRSNDFVSSPLLRELAAALATIDKWNTETLLEKIKQVLDKTHSRFPAIYQDLLGIKQGLPLADVFAILG